MTKSKSDHDAASLAPRRTFLDVADGAGGIACRGAGRDSRRRISRRRGAPTKAADDIGLTLGPVSGFPKNETRLKTFDNPLAQPWDGVTRPNRRLRAQFGTRRKISRINSIVFAINCTHLGCPVEWFPQSGLFMCPCHGGVYYENGERRQRAAAARAVSLRVASCRDGDTTAIVFKRRSCRRCNIR